MTYLIMKIQMILKFNYNDRNQNITISLTVDGYASEASWNVWDYANQVVIIIQQIKHFIK